MSDKVLIKAINKITNKVYEVFEKKGFQATKSDIHTTVERFFLHDGKSIIYSKDDADIIALGLSAHITSYGVSFSDQDYEELIELIEDTVRLFLSEYPYEPNTEDLSNKTELTLPNGTKMSINQHLKKQ